MSVRYQQTTQCCARSTARGSVSPLRCSGQLGAPWNNVQKRKGQTAGSSIVKMKLFMPSRLKLVCVWTLRIYFVPQLPAPKVKNLKEPNLRERLQTTPLDIPEEEDSNEHISITKTSRSGIHLAAFAANCIVLNEEVQRRNLCARPTTGCSRSHTISSSSP